MTAQIECTDLVRIFAAEGVEVQALQGLTLRVESGELTAVVGASGSGKSTLLTILSGLDVPTAGSASVAGHDLLAMDAEERTTYRRHTAGFVWQQTSRNLLPYLTGAENVAMALAVAGHRDACAPPGSTSSWTCSRSGTSATGCLRRCPEVSSSAWPSPSPSPTRPRCSSPTSRPASSTRPAPSWCSTRCAT